MSEFEGEPKLVKKRFAALLVTHFSVFVVSIFMITSMMLLVISTVKANSTYEQLISCTTPDKPCHVEGQKRTAAAVAQLIQENRNEEALTRQIVVLATFCAQENTTFKAIEKCVNDKLEELR